MTKAALRTAYKEKRKQLSPQLIEKFTDLILINFQQIALPFVSVVHTYLASDNLIEADTSTLVRYLKFINPGLITAVPKIGISGSMQHFHYDDATEFIQNAFGIDEPANGELIDAVDIDLVFVPLLAFDTDGYRVGYGKGYYDKFLSQCREDVIAVGLSFFDGVDTIDDINEYDIPLSYCITPGRIFEF